MWSNFLAGTEDTEGRGLPRRRRGGRSTGSRGRESALRLSLAVGVMALMLMATAAGTDHWAELKDAAPDSNRTCSSVHLGLWRQCQTTTSVSEAGTADRLCPETETAAGHELINHPCCGPLLEVQDTNFYKDGNRMLHDRWTKCVNATNLSITPAVDHFWRSKTPTSTRTGTVCSTTAGLSSNCSYFQFFTTGENTKVMGREADKALFIVVAVLAVLGLCLMVLGSLSISTSLRHNPDFLIKLSASFFISAGLAAVATLLAFDQAVLGLQRTGLELSYLWSFGFTLAASILSSLAGTSFLVIALPGPALGLCNRGKASKPEA
ncbi:voltage-dependent calcium channel gamma-6 subunit-like isoform X1 [Mobula hypostoma]|uniref:voltage-dependent calcium channel gamma-6 subunit-like isoform X1 n=1 Tax=Mobula hypostoma TaxID=723540 RepID=UPI002FC33BA3